MSRSSFDINQHQNHIESKIVVALERVSQAFRVLLWQESKEHSLSPIQIQILIFLSFHSDEKCKVSYLANEFNMTKATISDSVKLLFQKQLIQKVSDLVDTRSFSIALTRAGREIAKRSSFFAELIEKPINQFTQRQKEVLLTSLLELIEKLQKDEVITIQRMCLTCRFHSKDKNTHHCALLTKTLLTADLNIDCPDYQLAS